MPFETFRFFFLFLSPVQQLKLLKCEFVLLNEGHDSHIYWWLKKTEYVPENSGLGRADFDRKVKSFYFMCLINSRAVNEIGKQLFFPDPKVDTIRPERIKSLLSAYSRETRSRITSTLAKCQCIYVTSWWLPVGFRMVASTSRLAVCK